MTASTPPRVLIIGWDGADWNILRPMMDGGVLPNLKRLAERCLVGDLLSTIPPATASAWTTFLTGLQPGRHGLITWQAPLNASFQRPLLNASHIAGSRLWHRLATRNLRSCFLNVPLTYPPEPLDGVMVSGMLTPGPWVEFTYPVDFRRLLLQAVPDYQLDVEMQHAEKDFRSPQTLLAHLEEIRRTAQQRTAAWRLSWETHGPFDVAMIVFEGMDRLQHPFCAFALDHPAVALEPGASRHIAQIKEAYRHLDAQLAGILEACGEETTVILVSDHGFSKLNWEFFINEWLACAGWLRYKQGVGRLYKTLRPLVRSVKGLLPRGVIQHGRSRFSGFQAFDWTRTAAYSGLGSENGVWLNRQGREPKGIVSSQEYSKVRAAIIEGLAGLSAPDGTRLFKKALPREEVYHGPFLDRAADIVLELEEGIKVSAMRNPAGAFRDKRGSWEGCHRREGILAACGPQVKAGSLAREVTLADLTPTILALCGAPIPDGAFDGRVITEIAPTFATCRCDEAAPDRKAVAFSDREADRLKEQLRGMGYMD